MPADELSDRDAARLARLTRVVVQTTECLQLFVAELRARYCFEPGDKLAEDNRTIHRAR